MRKRGGRPEESRRPWGEAVAGNLSQAMRCWGLTRLK
jgi:hypothetical protein